MTQAKLQENICWRLMQLALQSKPRYAQLAEAHELTSPQFYALCAFTPDRTVPTSFVATLLGCDASNATSIVDRLVHLGHLTRQENPHDRRQKLITLSPAGRELQLELIASLPAYQPDALASLNPADQQQLYQILGRALGCPDSANDPARPHRNH